MTTIFIHLYINKKCQLQIDSFPWPFNTMKLLQIHSIHAWYTFSFSKLNKNSKCHYVPSCVKLMMCIIANGKIAFSNDGCKRTFCWVLKLLKQCQLKSWFTKFSLVPYSVWRPELTEKDDIRNRAWCVRFQYKM